MTVKLLAWETAVQTLLELVNAKEAVWQQILRGQPMVVLRDWPGRLHLCVTGTLAESQRVDGFVNAVVEIHRELGPLSAASHLNVQSTSDIISGLVLFREDLFDPDGIWATPDKASLQQTPFRVFLVDRQDKEADWLRPRLPNSSVGSQRAAFFGVKGGVGRSTALVGLALRLGQMGKKVLVIDADFESPGLSSSLMPAEVRPDYGLVDWFAADALNAAEAEGMVGLGTMVEASPLNQQIAGRILVTPSFGVKSEAYVSKLGRLYAPNDTTGAYGERLSKVLNQLEVEHSPDVTLIDSRAGIDDTSAVVLTRLGAKAFLFALNTTQTWEAYALLFKHLQRHPSIHTSEDFRADLRIISALTPDPAMSPAYFESMRQRAYDLFQEIYDEIPPGEDGLDSFNFDFDDSDAPHNPWRIRWDDSLRAFDPVRFEEHMNMDLQEKVFGEFAGNAVDWLGVKE